MNNDNKILKIINDMRSELGEKVFVDQREVNDCVMQSLKADIINHKRIDVLESRINALENK